MRLNDSIQVLTSTTTPDGYGGYTTTTPIQTTIFATVSVADDELKPNPSGYGFYRTISIIVDKSNGLVVGNVVGYNDSEYKLIHQVPLRTARFSAFVGYEV